MAVNWDKYLAPDVQRWLSPFDTVHQSMYAVGVVEIIAGIVVLLVPRVGGYVVALWLAGIVINLALIDGYWNVLGRDIALLVLALSFARLASDIPRRASGRPTARRRAPTRLIRAIRYRAAADWMVGCGLTRQMTIIDVGAGMTELDYCLRVEYGWRGRYIPVDGGVDGVDLNGLTPPRNAHFFVALEIIAHLYNWRALIERIQSKALVGLVLSTPNPRTTDVMDPTHVVEVYPTNLEPYGFHVSEETFYGGVYSGGEPDALFATWRCST